MTDDHFVEAAVRKQIKLRQERLDDGHQFLDDLRNWYDMYAPPHLFNKTVAELNKLHGEVALLDSILKDAKDMEREANELTA